MIFHLKRVILGFGIMFLLIFCWVGYHEANEFAESKALCSTWEYHLMSRAAETFTPTQVVVEPWKGRHHVYGIFAVPLGVYPEGILKVSLPGLGEVCGGVTDVQFSQAPIRGVQPKAGTYLIKANLRSRLVLWVILQGYFNSLLAADAWRLY